MAGFYERRQSRAALWCLRLSLLAIPFFLLTVFFQRTGAITPYQTFWLIAVGIAMLLASIVFGLRAAADLWEKGYKGGRATVNGIALSILLLLPFGLQLFNAIEYPQLNEAATDVVNPPPFLSLARGAARADAAEAGYDDYHARLIVSAYPELVTRRYAAPVERVAAAAVAILDRWGWPVTASRNLPAPEEGEGGEGGNREPGEENPAGILLGGEVSAGGDTTEAVPDILIEAEAKSLILKLPARIAIRLAEIDGMTVVDARSASSWGPHDFGGNAKNIRDFLAALDDALTGIAGEI